MNKLIEKCEGFRCLEYVKENEVYIAHSYTEKLQSATGKTAEEAIKNLIKQQ